PLDVGCFGYDCHWLILVPLELRKPLPERLPIGWPWGHERAVSAGDSEREQGDALGERRVGHKRRHWPPELDGARDRPVERHLPENFSAHRFGDLRFLDPRRFAPTIEDEPELVPFH